MESILARALEYTLKYWLKSFSRDQFKLQGRTGQLSNLDLNGDALHSSLGLPPALHVTSAKVGKLEIVLPSVSNVQTEPIVVQVDRLDVVLEENSDPDACKSSNSTQSSSSSGKGSGYGFADKIADGMTLEIHTVNVLLGTHGAVQPEGETAWASPLASITIRNLFLYTTNEKWQVVNLKEARDFSNNKKFIYVFKKLQWESLSIDLLPHPDMFTGDNASCSQMGVNKVDDDGAKRVFFGGERFIDGISAQAYITVQRTALNSPLGLEVQFHITEAVCPALSEPGLRALLRFLTGLYVCLNRGDVDPKALQQPTESAGRTLISIVVDHIFLCIKDSEFQLELLMQSLFFSRASVSDGEISKHLSRVMIGGLFLRDPFSHPPCTLVQPSMQAVTNNPLQIPDFGRNFCPPIYPLGDQPWQLNEGVPLICFHSIQVKPSPAPPSFASQTVIDCQPLMIYLQEESCLRISSFVADGIVVGPGAVLPDFSVNSFLFTLKELDITVPLDIGKSDNPAGNSNTSFQSSFAGARLHIENMFFSESPSLKLRLLNLDKDPACFCLWEDQPIDASQKKWTSGSSDLSLSLETCNGVTGLSSSLQLSSGLWKCVELKDACIEVAMVTADGNPLINVPPPGGVVRIGVACQQYLSNTSVEQLFFVLDLYAYFGGVSEKIALIGKNNRPKKSKEEEPLVEKLMEKVPSDTAVSLAVKDLKLRFLESSSTNIHGMPLVQFVGEDLFIKVIHRTLGGAIAVSSTLRWESVEIDSVDTEANLENENGMALTSSENGYSQLKAVFWVHKRTTFLSNGKVFTVPFLDINTVHVIPLGALDMESHSLSVSACIAGVRLGGGMNYAEALLHRFGLLGPDGGPGEGLSKGLEHLSAGPLSKIFTASPLAVDELKENGSSGDEHGSSFFNLGKPDDVDVSIELKDWLFALEGAQDMVERCLLNTLEVVGREERCWHTSFQSLQVKAKSSPQQVQNGKGKLHGSLKYPVELITVTVDGLQILKPQAQAPKSAENFGGISVEVRMVMSEDDVNNEMANWVVEILKFSVKQPIEAIVTKDELQHLAFLGKSEIDSMGRIAVGVLRVLKLDKSIGKAAINQLSNLGSEGFDKIFTQERLSRGCSSSSIVLTPSSNMNGTLNRTPESTLTLLEEAVSDSQAKCTSLINDLHSSSESSVEHIDSIKQLTQKLDSMQSLLMQLRAQI